ncbi:MAG: prolyl oligopeptidase family serine peptidase [Brevundimonas sp.]|uniref:prolyl oligopeptidase family serine peptidase n=1 Tax=Brevundimonas sp. TaxID=1871086 RepID=UPI00391C2765
MRHLILSAAIPALLLGACATTAPVAEAPAQQAAQRGPAPHFPADLSPAGVAAADDHLALEQVDGAEAMAFVAESNRKALAALEGDRRYETFRQQAQAILTATDRIPSPSFLGDGVGNFWQDAANPKGVWRRTTLASYRTETPQWETLIDVGALARAEGKDWVWKGVSCLAPDETRCLVNLSDGGKDAVVVREFDTTTKRFVDGGFVLPEGKHRISWLDRDTLLIATDFGPDIGSGNGRPTLTESGYPYIVKSLKRGQTLAQATEVYRGEQGDGGYGVSPAVYRDKDGNVEAVLFRRPLDTFRAETWRWVDGRAVKLNLPERVSIFGTQGNRLIFSNDQEFTWQEEPVSPGSLLSVPLAFLEDHGDGSMPVATNHLKNVIFTPGERQSIDSVRVMSDSILAVVSDNVVGTLKRFDSSAPRGHAAWRATDIAVPANSSVGLGDSSKSRGEVFVSTQGFLTPATLNLASVPGASLTELKTTPAKFDASTHVVEQFEAVSTDGTRIPYFVTRPRDQQGSAATILFGYGGFQASFPPIYRPEMGKLWLENGGVFVSANIRGGGEFGPAWHQAALRENRQRSFDDFAAVARDLQTRGITTPKQLGIYGRSNGGVLTSVSITQHPELFNAAVIESPLVDMLRYQELPAGASWIGEYGDPRIPGDAEFIARYSAYQQLRPDVDYPRVYLTTNTRDDRVHPGHARKFAARLGDMGHDHLYFEDTAGGHSNDADPVANARRWARHYVYLSQQLMD